MYGEEAGSLDLEHSTVSAKDSTEGKLKWTIKIITTVIDSEGEKKKEVLTVASKTKEERNDWLFALSSRVLYSHYLVLVYKQKLRPDLRIIGLFDRRNIGGIYLDDVHINLYTLKVLEKLLSSHTETERFSFQRAGLGNDEMSNIGNILKKKVVKSINLSNNNISSAGVLTLVQQNLNKQTAIGELNLAHNQIDDSCVEALCEVLAENKELHTLVLTGNKLTGSSFEVLSKTLVQMDNLTSLKLGQNEINDEGVAKLSPLLGSESSISTVKLQQNNITDKGVESMCKALEDNSSVKILNLKGNKIGTNGVLAIQQLLEENETLETIELSQNRNTVGGKEFEAFSEIPGVEFSEFSFRKV
jgi:Ran GTPase-activating protein (RanGAP) involved in mRNA processing and transport